MPQLTIENITIEVVQKKLRHMHLRVHATTGNVRISAPLRMSMETIRAFAASKIDWIKKHQEKFLAQTREASREYISKEGHYYSGKLYQLSVIERNAKPAVELQPDTITLFTRSGAGREQRKKLLDAWYRQQLKNTVPPLIDKWEKKLNVRVGEFAIKDMRTRWGTCNTKTKKIWLNLHLAKKPPEHLEYVVVHELMHLIERNHGPRFAALMTEFMPEWRSYKAELKFGPV